MKKFSKRSWLVVSYAYLILVPVIFSIVMCFSGKLIPSNYNETLIKNIVNDVSDSSQHFVLTLDSKQEKIKKWDTFSTFFNRDFYGYNTLFRVGKNNYSVTLKDEQKFDVLISDIEQCDITNNGKWNYSALFTKISMEDFREDSIIISDTLASSYSISDGDQIKFLFNDELISCTVLGVYDSSYSIGSYLNTTYAEIGAQTPLCFISRSVFNKLSYESYKCFLKITCEPRFIDSTYLELEPLLSLNSIKLIIDDSLSVNSLSINDKSLNDYQISLLGISNSEKNTKLIFFFSFIVVVFVFNCFITVRLLRDICWNNDFFYNHCVPLCFLYCCFVLACSLVSAFALKKMFFITFVGNISTYHSLKLSLIVLSTITIFYLLLVSIAISFFYKKRRRELSQQRKIQLAKFRESAEKIIFVTGSLSRGGAEKVIVELANFYASLGKKVDIVILLNNKVDWELHENVNVINFTGNTSSRIKRIGYWLKKMRCYFKENKYSTIVSFLVRVNILVLLSANSNEHKIIISERNDPRFDGRNFLVDCFTNFLYPKADTIVFQTKECMEMFTQQIQNKGIVISNPIKIKEYASPESFSENLFISAGRISKQKNQITMIKAMKYVVLKHPDARLEIYGDGDLTSKLKIEIIRNNLERNVFIFPNTRQINSKILQSAAYICTSLYEGMSNSLMEASFAGVPCITTPCLGTDFIIEGKNGFFIKTYDAKGLAIIINKLLEDRESLINLRKQSYNIAQNSDLQDVYYEWKRCIENE